MPRIRRSLKRDTEPESLPPTVSQTLPGNPFAKWLIGAAVLTLAIVGLPVAIWAQANPQGQKAEAQQGRVMVDASALKRITENLKDLQKAVDDLMGSQKAVQQDLASQQDGRAACLNTCRQTLVKCQAKEPAGEKSSTGLPPCLSQANECITKCNNVPRPPISCEDRCAVAVGGCLEKAMLSSAMGAVESCRKSNAECLMKACKLKETSGLPAGYCDDQCSRFGTICKAGLSAYDQEGVKDCEKMQANCQAALCTPSSNPMKSPSSSSTTSVLLSPDVSDVTNSETEMYDCSADVDCFIKSVKNGQSAIVKPVALIDFGVPTAFRVNTEKLWKFVPNKEGFVFSITVLRQQIQEDAALKENYIKTVNITSEEFDESLETTRKMFAAGVGSIRECKFEDVRLFIEDLQRWEQDKSSLDKMSYAKCESTGGTTVKL